MQRAVPNPDHIFGTVLDVRDFLAEHAISGAISQSSPPSEAENEALRKFFELSDNREHIAALKVLHEHISPPQASSSSQIKTDASGTNNSDALVGNLLTDPWAVPFGWYIRRNIMFKWQRDAIKRIWRPRQIGRITGSQTPDQFDGPRAKWMQFATEKVDLTQSDGVFPSMTTKKMIPQPRLCYVDDWGSENSKLLGLYMATHQRTSLSSGLQYYAVRQIDPATDPATRIDGLSPFYFEALAMNCTWVPMVIGSVDMNGDQIMLASGKYAASLNDTGLPSFAIHLHMNETLNRYRSMDVSQSTINDMQLLSLQTTANTMDTLDTTVSREDADLFMRMLCSAVLQASQVSIKFSDLMNRNIYLKKLRDQAAEPAKITTKELNIVGSE